MPLRILWSIIEAEDAVDETDMLSVEPEKIPPLAKYMLAA